MPTIMISYRRADAKAVAGRIYDRLASRYGEANVFMDVDHIPLGIDFRTHIRGVLLKSDVVLAVIGPGWLGATGNGRRRIDDAADPVRVEIETALTQGTRIIPLLVDDTPMPDAADLPEALKDVAFLNAAPVDSGRDFGAHMARLVASLDEILKDKGGAPAEAPPALVRPRKRLGGFAAAGLGAVAAVAFAVYGWNSLRPVAPPSGSANGSAATVTSPTSDAPPARMAAVAPAAAAAPATDSPAKATPDQPPAAAPVAAPSPTAMLETAAKPAPTPRARDKVFQVLSSGVSDGILNMRDGPGTRHPLVVSIPAGQSGVMLSGECRLPDDGGKKPWCRARWLKYGGWVSTCCIVDPATGAFPRVDLAAGTLID